MKIKDIYLENVKNLDKVQIDFSPKLNILTGANGTGKSTILNCLIQCINRGSIERAVTKTDQNKIVIHVDRGEPGTECLFINNSKNSSVVPNDETPILAFNPKRNVKREEFENILQRTLTQKDFAKYNKDIASHFDNGVYNEVFSIPEILSLKMRGLPKDATPQQYIDEIMKDFNGLASQIFPTLKIADIEYTDISSYKFLFENHGKPIDLNDLSTGEKEVLTLLVNIDYYKDDFKILIIDEPEVHLNWNLENKLFQILLKFAQNEDKQIILTTHSRVLLEYLEHQDVHLINLNLNEATNEVIVSNQNLSQELEEIIGKVTIFDKYEKIIVCEDELHKKVLEKVNEDKVATGKMKIVPLGDKGAVTNFIMGIDRFPAEEFKEKFIGYRDLDGDTPSTHARIKDLSKYSVENFFIQSATLFSLDQGKARKFSSQQDLEAFLLQKILDKTGEQLTTYDQTVIDGKKIKKILSDTYEYLGYDDLDVFINDYFVLSRGNRLFDEFKVQ